MVFLTHPVIKRSSSADIVPTVCLNGQSRELEESKHVRVSRLLFGEHLLSYLYNGVNTIHHCMLRGARISNNGPCVGWREKTSNEYLWLTYEQVLERAKNFGSGLAKYGLGKGSFLGVYSQNRVEYTIADFGAYSRSIVIVPLYDTLGPNACTFIITQAELSVVVCDREQKVLSLLSRVSETPCLRVIVAMEGVSEGTRKIASSCNVTIVPFEEVENYGERKVAPPEPPGPDDLAVVCYTSGTTGNPKGALLTHGNIVACVSAVLIQLGEAAICRDDVMLSFLPLAHLFERCCQAAVFMVGARVGYFSGDIQTLSEDFKALRPTVSPCVPRLLNKMYDKVQQTAATSSLKKALLDMAVSYKKNALVEDNVDNDGIWDKSVFKPIRDNLGGRIRLMVTGAAPISEHILTFLRCALGCVIVEAYGQTEVAGACTMTLPEDHGCGHVGPPVPSCAVKLVDVPDMDYYASEGKGEICIKGPSVFQGYLKAPRETKEALDEDGWLHTGDVGMWLPAGVLKIVDRKKNILKLSQGEYVSPEKIENAYTLSPLISQIFVYGDSLKSCVVGVVVLDAETARSKLSLQQCDLENANENQQVKAKVLNELRRTGEKAGLKSFEQVKDIYISSIPFTVENNLLTPTLKCKRHECRRFFRRQIDFMYGKLD